VVVGEPFRFVVGQREQDMGCWSVLSSLKSSRFAPASLGCGSAVCVWFDVCPKVHGDDTNNSVLVGSSFPTPPTTSTVPSINRVAACDCRR